MKGYRKMSIRKFIALKAKSMNTEKQKQQYFLIKNITTTAP